MKERGGEFYEAYRDSISDALITLYQEGFLGLKAFWDAQGKDISVEAKRVAIIHMITWVAQVVWFQRGWLSEECEDQGLTFWKLYNWLTAHDMRVYEMAKSEAVKFLKEIHELA